MQVPVMPSRPHEDAVVESFRDDPGFALYMLNRSLEEGDEAVFLNTLRRVAKTFGGISQVARQANLNETTIYRLLSGQGNPQLSSIMAILRVMGLRLAVVSAATEGASAVQASGDGAEGGEAPVEAEVAPA